MRRFLLACTLMLTGGLVCAGSPPVVLDTVYGARVGIAPMTVRFRATVQRDEHNRQLCFIWTSDTTSGQGCTSMDGHASPLTYWREITFRTPGDVIVVLQVDRNDNRTLLSNNVVIYVHGVGE